MPVPALTDVGPKLVNVTEPVLALTAIVAAPVRLVTPKLLIVKLAVGPLEVNELTLIPVSYTHLTLPTKRIV